jgi:hypothetical protein
MKTIKNRGEHSHISAIQAMNALQENLGLLDPVKHKSARNMTFALIYICDGIESLSRDVGLLHSKLQPILREIADDQESVHKMTR